ncbi:YesL family protein [Alkalihalobacillus sp. TS-13]|uniref:YesL family protein n=1 Tax=Alkalihalobacillus sp. TS-13 TaxID=2842455 RepID=UPI001C87FF1E|nr:DUF624 domain-containing protein [Alkalihalobacillus sp. TS-13]
MQLGLLSGTIYNMCNWFARLAYINFLWIFFSLLGLGIFGFFPSTIAMFATLRQFLLKNNPPVFKTFWIYYKEEFFRSNKIGLIILLISSLIYINFLLLQSVNHSLIQMIFFPMLIVTCLFLLTICYFAAGYVHFNQTNLTLFKNSFLIMIYNPVSNLFIIFGFVTIYYLVILIPGISFFFSGCLVALIILSSTSLAFAKIESKRKITPTYK